MFRSIAYLQYFRCPTLRRTLTTHHCFGLAQICRRIRLKFLILYFEETEILVLIHTLKDSKATFFYDRPILHQPSRLCRPPAKMWWLQLAHQRAPSYEILAQVQSMHNSIYARWMGCLGIRSRKEIMGMGDREYESNVAGMAEEEGNKWNHSLSAVGWLS